MEGGLGACCGGFNVKVRSWPLLTPLGRGKPPEISDPGLHSALGKPSEVGILSLLVNLKFFVERTQVR